MAEIERVEFALFWSDDEEEPLVIYPDEQEALDLAQMGGAIVMRRVLVIESVGDWEPNERQPHKPRT